LDYDNNFYYFLRYSSILGDAASKATGITTAITANTFLSIAVCCQISNEMKMTNICPSKLMSKNKNKQIFIKTNLNYQSG